MCAAFGESTTPCHAAICLRHSDKPAVGDFHINQRFPCYLMRNIISAYSFGIVR